MGRSRISVSDKIKTAVGIPRRSRAQFKRDVKLIELSLVLTGGLGLLLTLQAGADVVLALLNFSDNALLGAAPLKAAQCGLQRLVLLDANFRHCFPSLRWHPAKSWMRSGPGYSGLNIIYAISPNVKQ